MLPSPRPINRCASAALAILLCMSGAAEARQEQRADPSQICVTNGKVESAGGDTLVINSPSSRAILKSVDDSAGTLRFEYLGPAEGETKLASGVIRRQLGIKLRAVDSCNVIYIMWRIEPDSGIQVSMKVNKGKTSHAECGAKGYRLLNPTHEVPVAPIKVGEPRKLAASLDGRTLTVKVDDKVAWVGETFAEADDMVGYTGVRTDNVRIRFNWLADDAPALKRGARSAPPMLACKRVTR